MVCAASHTLSAAANPAMRTHYTTVRKASLTGATKTSRKGAALAIALVGVIHLVLAPEYFEKASYLGVLFLAGAVASGVVTLRLFRQDDGAAWLLGAVVAAGMFIGFILSRTVGLPGFYEQEWEPTGLVSLVLELVYLGFMLRSVGIASGRLRFYRA